MSGGRPTIYSEELADEICRRIASGRAISSVGDDDDMPSEWTVYNWRNTNEAFSKKLTRAREDRIEGFVGRMIGYANSAEDEHGLDPNRINAAVSAIDKAARLQMPKKLEVTGKDGTAFIQPMSDFEVARRIVFLLQKGVQSGAPSPDDERADGQ